MYISKDQNGYILTPCAENALVLLHAPAFIENGETVSLEKAETGYLGGGISCVEKKETLGGGLFKITRSFTNLENNERKLKFLFDASPLFDVNKYLIPSVSYNGNEWGEGKEPKGMYADNGEIWVHPYDHTTIPSCSLTENKEQAFSMFVSTETEESTVSSVSVFKDNGRYGQRILWPMNEAPYTYFENDQYREAFETFITLNKNETFTAAVYLLLSTPRWENYGIADTIDLIPSLFPFKNKDGSDRRPCHSPEKLWELGMAYSQYLLMPYRGKLLYSSGSRPVKNGLALLDHFEIGWCGQNIMNARMSIVEYLKTGNKQLLTNAMAVCDAWIEKQFDNGLILGHYEWYTEGREWNYKPRDPNKSWASNVDYKNGWLPETCNTGWAASEMLKVYKLLSDNGIEKPEYREFAKKIVDFFERNYSEEFAFGKAWHFEGEKCEEPGGTIGLFITMAMIDAYKILGDEKYLEAAKKSFNFYMERDINNFVCTAGAIDCTCVDKETAGPALFVGIALYEITGDKKYLEDTEKAAYYFLSWMCCYDMVYTEDDEFTQYGYYTQGSTSVSVQHPALDQWGEIIVPELYRLAAYTGDKKWEHFGYMIWTNCTQCIATEENRVFHGMPRPIGSQNEAFYMSHWGHNRDIPNIRGYLNDWLVSWVNAFRLYVIDKMPKEDLDKLN